MRRPTLGVVVVTLVALLIVACGGPPAPAGPISAPRGDPGLVRRLVDGVSADGAVTHLQVLQGIADRHGGNRASGTPGHEQSADHVADALRRAGFRVETPTFTFPVFTATVQTLAIAGAPGPAVRAINYSPTTPPTGLTAPLVVLPDDPTPGCEPEDHAGRPVAGAIVLVDLGVCTITQKHEIAAQAGATAMIVSNTVDLPLRDSLDMPEAGRIAVGGVSRRDGESLAAREGRPVTLTLLTRSEVRTSRNVLAQTVTGRTDEVVLSGAHLDSVPNGPGINDNGSGSAAQLELALRLGSVPPVTNAVRFAWWGAEEAGLWGSNAYVRDLSPEARRDVALVINTDMLGSPNAAYLVFDGDDSDRVGAPAGPPGSEGVERSLVAALGASGVRAGSTDFNGRSDYGPFIDAGIPAGGLFSGAADIKTSAGAGTWGGVAGQAYDPCYHRPCDTLTNVDRVALARMLDALATTVGGYAVDLGGPNGVPSRDQRGAS